MGFWFWFSHVGRAQLGIPTGSGPSRRGAGTTRWLPPAAPGFGGTREGPAATGGPSPRPARAYLGMCLLLPHEAVGGHPQLGHTSVPHVLHQGPDLVCFGNIVRSATEEQGDRSRGGALGKVMRQPGVIGLCSGVGRSLSEGGAQTRSPKVRGRGLLWLSQPGALQVDRTFENTSKMCVPLFSILKCKNFSS